MKRIVKVKDIPIGLGSPLVLIAGPCVIESEELILKTAERIRKMTDKLKFPFIFKSSYTKANRLSIDSYSGPGLEKGLKILEKVKRNMDIPVLTDIHSREEASPVSEVADVLQIPAFLCRQTDIVLSAAKTGKVLNIKKGQFMAPQDMNNVAKKAESAGNDKVLLTERGTTFGYHNLVVDFRSLIIMSDLGYPVIFDATHSLQLPGGGKTFSSGESQFIFPLSRGAVACGCDAIFIETHPNVNQALCDKGSMLPLDSLEKLLSQIKLIDEHRRSWLKEAEVSEVQI